MFVKPHILGGFRINKPVMIDRVLDIAKRDIQYFKHEVYELIGDPDCYVDGDIIGLAEHFAPECKTTRTDVVTFGNVKPHVDEMSSKDSFLVHMILHGSGVFESAGESIPVKPGTVFAMNPFVEHSFKTTGKIVSLCMEKE